MNCVKKFAADPEDDKALPIILYIFVVFAVHEKLLSQPPLASFHWTLVWNV